MKSTSNHAPGCSYVLDNGQPCHAPARRGSPLCRHHAPEALARRQAADPGPARGAAQPSAEPGAIDPWALRGYWRMHHRLIPAYSSDALDDTFDMILGALANRQIAPRSAGRLLLAILDRRRALAREAQEANFRALLRQAQRAPGYPMSNSTTPPEGLRKYPVSVVHPARPAKIRI